MTEDDYRAIMFSHLTLNENNEIVRFQLEHPQTIIERDILKAHGRDLFAIKDLSEYEAMIDQYSLEILALQRLKRANRPATTLSEKFLRAYDQNDTKEMVRLTKLMATRRKLILIKS